MKKEVGLSHKHFHDSRREVATRLSKVFKNTLELSAITGHKRLDILKRYYNPTGNEMRKRLPGSGSQQIFTLKKSWGFTPFFGYAEENS